jgi:hypothetical protein
MATVKRQNEKMQWKQRALSPVFFRFSLLLEGNVDHSDNNKDAFIVFDTECCIVLSLEMLTFI